MPLRALNAFSGLAIRRRCTQALVTCVALTVAACVVPSAGQRAAGATFPSDPKLSYERFGLFIGIDKYSVLSAYNLNGCVNDATNYKNIFVDAGRFDVQRYAVLTNQQATRAGITQALKDLVEEVRTAREKLGAGKDITVVITYSGHGALVPRKDPQSPLGPMDSSWVAADSDLQGTKNILGEELFAIHTALRNLGANVIMISDSCHSGTAYRGLDKARGIELSRDATGPTDGAFAGLIDAAHLPASREAYLNPPGFVWYAACGDSQQAFETTDSNRKHCGRFSMVMQSVLLHATDTTYSGLARQIAEEFANRWPDNQWQQTPEFHVAAGKENGGFFTDKIAPLHAEVKAVNSAAKTAEISMGEIQGLADGTFIRFYRGMNDAVAHHNQIATGTVTRVGATTSTVTLDKVMPLSAWGIPEHIQMLDFSVAMDDGAGAAAPPAWLKGKLAELDKAQQLRLVSMNDAPTAVIRCLPNNQIGIYPPTALPGGPVAAGAAADKPLRLLSMPAKAEDYSELLAENLLYVARLKRFAGLEHACQSPLTSAAADQGLPALDADVVNLTQSAAAAPAPNGAAAPSVKQLRDGDKFLLRITNNTTRSMYATVFTVKADGTIKILYPQAGDDRAPINSGKRLEIGRDSPFSVSLNNPAMTAERTQLKVIATDSEVPFDALLVPPQTGAENVRGIGSRGGDDALVGLFRDVLHGGPLTRDVDIARQPAISDWGTLNVVFDAVPKK